MDFDLQPILSNDKIYARPLLAEDFDSLFAVAADPLLWAQHPNPDRYQRSVFEIFFQGALASRGALLVHDAATGGIIGSSRYYDLDPRGESIFVGYTFLARSHWGGVYNPALKELMLDHAFRFLNQVFFHIGSGNIRSQKAIERLGATKTGELDVAYYGEPPKRNFVYRFTRSDWRGRKISVDERR